MSWLNRFVDSGLERYERLCVVQPYREVEKYAPACVETLLAIIVSVLVWRKPWGWLWLVRRL